MASVPQVIFPNARPAVNIDPRPVATWVRVSRNLNADDGLTKCERLVKLSITRLTQIKTLNNERSYPDLATDSGVSERSAKSAVSTLEAKGEIVVIRGGGRLPNRYFLPVAWAGKPPASEVQICTPAVQNRTGPLIRNRREEDHHQKEDKINFLEHCDSENRSAFSGPPPPEKPPLKEKSTPIASDEPKKLLAFARPELPPRKFESDRQEIAFRYEERFGMKLEWPVLDYIESTVASRGLTLAHYLASIWPHWVMGRFTCPPGFARKFADKMPRITPQLMLAFDQSVPIRKTCDRCKFGVLPTGDTCDCPTGQDLARAHAKSTKQNTTGLPDTHLKTGV